MRSKATRPNEPTKAFPALIIAALLVPAMLFAAAAWRDRSTLLRRAEGDGIRLMAAFHEQAESLLKRHDRFLAVLVSRLQDQGWPALADSPDLLQEAVAADASLDDMPAVLLVDADGETRATMPRQQGSQPVPSGDRVCLVALQRLKRRTCVGQPRFDPRSGKYAFALARRLEKGGAFDGMAQVEVSADHLVSVWASMKPNVADTISLSRMDGAILAQSTSRSQPVARFYAIPTLPMNEIMKSGPIVMAARATSGAGDPIVISRPITDYSVNVVLELDRSAILATWYHDAAIYGLVAAGTSAAILLALGLALRRARDAGLATSLWQAETQARETIQEQLWQSQKMESLGKLTGGIAHDFNNLLTVIVGNLGMLERAVLDPNRKRQLQSALKAGQTAKELTQQLLAFARKQAPRPRSINVLDVIEGMQGLLVRTLSKDIRLRIEADSAVWPALIDPTQLELILLNLAINARDAMPHGGTLCISLANRDFDRDTPQELTQGHYVVLKFADTGTGMDAATLARATEPFFTTKELGKGTGLGLSMMQTVVVQSAGATRLRSTPGIGTEVEIWLPRTRLPPEATAARGSMSSVRPRGQTVVVCDDNPTVLEFVGDVLNDDGYQVIAVNSVDAVLTILKSEAPIGLLIVDFAMLQMDGAAVAHQVRASHAERPILVMTVDAEFDASKVEAEDMPILRKPFSQEQLTTRIRQLLQKKSGDAFGHEPAIGT